MRMGDMFMTFAPRPGESLLAMLARAANAVRRRARASWAMTIFNGKAEFFPRPSGTSRRFWRHFLADHVAGKRSQSQ